MVRRSLILVLAIFSIVVVQGCTKDKAEKVDNKVSVTETKQITKKEDIENTKNEIKKTITQADNYTAQKAYLNAFRTLNTAKDKYENESKNLGEVYTALVNKVDEANFQYQYNTAIQDCNQEDFMHARESVAYLLKNYPQRKEVKEDIRNIVVNRAVKMISLAEDNVFVKITLDNLKETYPSDNAITDLLGKINTMNANKQVAEAKAEIQKEYAGKPPFIGMDANVVTLSSWGNPDHRNKTTTQYGTTEQWVYSNNRYVYIENGRVTAIQESN